MRFVNHLYRGMRVYRVGRCSRGAHAAGVDIRAGGASATEHVSPMMDAVAEGAMAMDGRFEAALGLYDIVGAVVGRSTKAGAGCDLMSRAWLIALSAADDTSAGAACLAGSRGGFPAAPFFLGSGCISQQKMSVHCNTMPRSVDTANYMSQHAHKSSTLVCSTEQTRKTVSEAYLLGFEFIHRCQLTLDKCQHIRAVVHTAQSKRLPCG